MNNVSRIRKAVAVLVFVVLALSLLLHGGSGTLAAIGYEQIALVCPVGQLEVMLSGHKLMLHPILLFLAAIVLAIVFGKAFCSWLCPTKYIQNFFHGKTGGKKQQKPESGKPSPVAAMQVDAVDDADNADNAGRSAEKLPENRSSEQLGVVSAPSGCGSALPPAGGERDGLRIDSRHGVLAGALASSAIFGFPVFCLVCPVGLTFATFIGIINLIRFNETSWMLLVFPAIVVIEVVLFRKWCTSLCPVAALLSLVSGLNKTFKPEVDQSKCLRSEGVDCRSCVNVCPERVDPHNELIPECNKCGDCLAACPAHAISVKIVKSLEKK